MRRLYVLIIALFVLPPAALASDHHHEHHDSPAKLQMNHGKQWQTDAPLRENMSSVATMLRAKVPSIHTGAMTAAEYAELGAAIEVAIGRIVKDCALPAEADAMLHLVIGELAAAAESLQGKAEANQAGAAQRAVVALNNYGKFFKHPGWVPVR